MEKGCFHDKRLLDKSEFKNGKLHSASPLAQPPKCPECTSQKVWKDGIRRTTQGDVQRWVCRDCGFRFSPNESKNSPKPTKADADAATMSTVRCPHCKSQRIWKDGIHQTNNGAIQRYICRSCGKRFIETTWNRLNTPEHLQKIHRQILFSSNTLVSNRRVSVREPKRTKNSAVVERDLLETIVKPEKPSLLRKSPAEKKIFEFAFWLKKNGYAESTIIGRVKLLKIMVRRGAILYDPESIKEVIAKQKWSQGRKSNAVDAYSSFLQMVGGKWDPPRYERPRRLPFIPLEQEVDQLIAGLNKRMATFCQLIKETGARPGEAHKLKWIDIDPNSDTIRINEPEKEKQPTHHQSIPKAHSNAKHTAQKIRVRLRHSEAQDATEKLPTTEKLHRLQATESQIKRNQLHNTAPLQRHNGIP